VLCSSKEDALLRTAAGKQEQSRQWEKGSARARTTFFKT